MGSVLAIIGSGHLGQQIAYHSISDKHFDDVVFFDDFETKSHVNGFRVLGKIDEVQNLFDTKAFDYLIIGIGYKHMSFRAEIFDKFKLRIPFTTIIHSTCIVDKSAVIGKGVILYPGVIIDANVVLKDNILVNIGVCISHETIIESHCFLSPRVAIAGLVKLGEGSVLGINSTIIDTITIIKHTQIGGGSVVIKDITKSGVFVGNPARFIR